MTNKVIYQPLQRKLLRGFAHEVGVRLADQQNDVRYADQDVVDGLADFLRILTDLLVKQLNAQADEGLA